MAHPLLRSILARRMAALGARSRGRVLELSADALIDEGDDAGAYDTILSCGVLCGVPDIDRALRRIDALLAPGGQVLAVEHVRVPGLYGRLQDAADRFRRWLPTGGHVHRDVIAALRRNGFAVTDCERHTWRGPIVGPHVSAVAIRAAKISPVKDENE